MKVLQVIDQAFRTNTEEQDDTILWLIGSMRGVGADLMLLLSGHSAYYAVLRQRQPPLSLAEWQQTQPADIPKDVTNLITKGVPIYVIKEDLEERGLGKLPLISGVKVVARNALANLYEQADQVWNW
ncbi:MAG: DsrE family protein [Spongiibacteraceae bacterium]|jgi:hypothetical protein